MHAERVCKYSSLSGKSLLILFSDTSTASQRNGDVDFFFFVERSYSCYDETACDGIPVGTFYAYFQLEIFSGDTPIQIKKALQLRSYKILLKCLNEWCFKLCIFCSEIKETWNIKVCEAE